jgi:hypothetical protein
MNKPESLSGMVSDLIRRGLPAEYAQRTAAEFADHHRDLVEELQSTGFSESQAITEASRRLGDSHTLAKKTVRAYQRQHWCGRWRIATFVLFPIPLLALLWLATILGWGLCVVLPLKMLNLLGTPEVFDGTISTGERIVSCLIQGWFLFAMPALAMFLLVRLSRRAALGSRWLGIAAIVLAFSALFMTCGYPDPRSHAVYMDGRPVPADQFMFTAGMPVPSRLLDARNFDLLGRMLLPLAFAGMMYLRDQRSSNKQAGFVGNC